MVIFVVLVGACSDDKGGVPSASLSEATIPGVYSGVFPCDGCPGIEATLWLRQDRRFFFEQRYPAGDDTDAMDVYGLGQWHSLSAEQAIRLQGAGPQRTFDRRDSATLLMRSDSELEYRLTRRNDNPEFSATIRMAGMMRVAGQRTIFTECLTGMAVPVSKDGDYRRFQHQYRSVSGPGGEAYVELEGRFSWSADGAPASMTIERFVSARTEDRC